ncbi:sulfite exporter TauE/SafE family protein, partial [Helicobacter bizzozeronii]|uniref:sulfite exporter TauE/SafE family protein n=1 Tax=Helicobacter bizzozeronii TaxID=56877 RepID=UPI00255737AF
QAFTQRAHAVRPVAGRMLLGALVGAPVGLAILTVTTGRQLRFFLAGVIFAFLVLTLRGFTLHRASRSVDLGAGVVAGVLNTSLSTNGPPIVMALHARELSPDPFRGTIAAVFTGSNVIAVVLFTATGRYDADSLVLFAVSLPALGIGYLVGSRMRRRFDAPAFRRLTLWLLGPTGVVTLVGAVLA